MVKDALGGIVAFGYVASGSRVFGDFGLALLAHLRFCFYSFRFRYVSKLKRASAAPALTLYYTVGIVGCDPTSENASKASTSVPMDT